MAADVDALAEFLAKARGSLDRRITPEAENVTELWSLASLRGRLVELSARGASATLTTAIELVLEAQVASEPVAWIMLDTSSFYPPDVADAGIDLSALVVIRVQDGIGAARAAQRILRSGAFGLVIIDLSSDAYTRADVEAEPAAASASAPAPRATLRAVPGDPRAPSTQRMTGEPVLRVISAVPHAAEPPGARAEVRADISTAHQGRLVSLAQTHDAAVVVLTEKAHDAASIGSLVSLHVEALRSADELTVRALKDKRCGPGWSKKTKVRTPY